MSATLDLGKDPENHDMPEAALEQPRARRPNFLTATRFVDFDLPPEILEGLDAAGFEYCTPIQAQAIPVALTGHDIAGQAQTGTGKTTAFLVPLLTRLMRNQPLKPNCPRALIVTPTRELAQQIHNDALILAKNAGFRQALVIGGMEYREQADLLAEAPELVICTPGRIIDYLQQGIFLTKGIEAAVVDEADRLLDMGFIKDLKYLLGKLPPYSQRQTMLFSATLDQRVLELTYEFMNPPQFITAEPNKTNKINIEQELYHIGRDEKLLLLLGLLRRESHNKVIIFRNTKSGVEWLAKKLAQNGLPAEGITGDLPQPKRLKLMEAFKENRLQILVATDVASRGIHVDDVSHVYNFDLPQDAENYIHRIGRTARAGKAGKAVSFGCEDYVFHLEAIENLLGEKIPVHWPEAEHFHPDEGGEVRLKTDSASFKKPNDRAGRDGGRRSGGPGGESGGDRRGPARSRRPGGIFGLSPQLPVDADHPDQRFVLSWELDGEKLPPHPLVQTAVEPLAEENGELREGRRRKRRRKSRSQREEAVRIRAAAGDTPVPETGITATPLAEQSIPETAEPDPAPRAVEPDQAKTSGAPSAKEVRTEESDPAPLKNPTPRSRKTGGRRPAAARAGQTASPPAPSPIAPASSDQPPEIQPEAPAPAAPVKEKKPQRTRSGKTKSSPEPLKAASAGEVPTKALPLENSAAEPVDQEKPKRSRAASKKSTQAEEAAPKAREALKKAESSSPGKKKNVPKANAAAEEPKAAAAALKPETIKGEGRSKAADRKTRDAAPAKQPRSSKTKSPQPEESQNQETPEKKARPKPSRVRSTAGKKAASDQVETE